MIQPISIFGAVVQRVPLVIMKSRRVVVLWADPILDGRLQSKSFIDTKIMARGNKQLHLRVFGFL